MFTNHAFILHLRAKDMYVLLPDNKNHYII